MYIHPTIELDNPDYYGLVTMPVDKHLGSHTLRFIQHSLADLGYLHGAFNGNDWQEPKLGGDISTGRVFELLAENDEVPLNMVPWGFFWLPIVHDPTGVYFSNLFIQPTSKDDYDAMDWLDRANYIAAIHIWNDHFILRLRNEVRVLAGNTTRGRPRLHNP